MTEKTTYLVPGYSLRKEEIRQIMKLKPGEVKEKAGSRLRVCEDLDELHKKFARDIADEIIKNNNEGQPSRFILPIGPTGQYPYLIEILEEENISLKDCWFFFMDEYCDRKGNAISIEHPLSFKKIAKNKFLDQIPESSELSHDHVFFPDEKNINLIADIIDQKAGGIDVCFGGIGIHGHVAFNEPALNIAKSGPRRVKLNNFTITINAIRSEVGGNLENFPNEALTIGMAQILDAKKIRLYCRNGTPYDWANTILRVALFGTPGDDYPVTYIRKHPDYMITTDKNTLKTPKNIL